MAYALKNMASEPANLVSALTKTVSALTARVSVPEEMVSEPPEMFSGLFDPRSAPFATHSELPKMMSEAPRR